MSPHVDERTSTPQGGGAVRGYDPTPMLSIREVAEKCNVTAGTVRKWRENGVGPKWYRLGKHLRCEAADFLAWLEQCAEDDHAEPQAADHFDDGWD